MRLQLEGGNDEQTPGDAYEGDVHEVFAQGHGFIDSIAARSMPQALQSHQPLLRPLQTANLPETHPVPLPHPPLSSQPSSPPALSPNTPTLLERPERE
jgi:hypothetical protein